MSTNDYGETAIGESAESQKIYCMISRYTEDKIGLDIGCGGWKLIDSIGIDIRKGAADIIGDVSNGLEPLFKKARKKTILNKKFDYIFSSHLLEDFDTNEQMKMLNDWLKYIKPGGHLILYVPEKGIYKGCNQAHKHEFSKGELETIFDKLKLTVTDVYYESEADTGYGIIIAGKKNQRD